jgi:hypothetical protein
MGVGASNMSTSDLSVYQDALTKISSDLISATSNVSNINLNSQQKINFKNGPMVGCDSLSGQQLVFENRSKYTNLCQHGMTNQTYPPKSDQAGLPIVQNFGCRYFREIGAMSEAEYNKCMNDCSDQAYKLYPDYVPCTPQEKLASTPTINCNITIDQSSVQNATTAQAADNNINASMTTAITSKFESEIDKTISQMNKDLNFMQQNSSDERTALSQSIRNDVRNAISQTSSNDSMTFQNNEQTIDFENKGAINCGGCGEKPPMYSKLSNNPKNQFPTQQQNGQCLLLLKQSNVQTAKTDQKATAALKSIYDNTITNDLASSYSLKVDQKNAGVNLAELLLTLLLPLIFLILFVPLCIWAGSKAVGSMKDGITELLKSVGKLLFYGTIIAGLAILILWSACQMPTWGPTSSGPTWCYHPTTAPTSSPTATPTPTPTPRPQNALCTQSSHKCTYSTYNACNAACTAANITPCKTVFDPNTQNAVYCGPC